MTMATDADRRRWQRQALTALDELLQRDLPLVDWTVTRARRLVADLNSLNLAPPEIRAVLAAWAGSFGEGITETRLPSGEVWLYVIAEVQGYAVNLSARILPEDRE